MWLPCNTFRGFEETFIINLEPHLRARLSDILECWRGLRGEGVVNLSKTKQIEALEDSKKPSLRPSYLEMSEACKRIRAPVPERSIAPRSDPGTYFWEQASPGRSWSAGTANLNLYFYLELWRGLLLAGRSQISKCLADI
jgi:hypothetical protein